ncbi:hypothetical protein IJ135_02465 [Candidatus Saccharibacteria bacterium]|nr:hypothetical protein [Candidatus Saccharibacteria bacterium]
MADGNTDDNRLMNDEADTMQGGGAGQAQGGDALATENDVLAQGGDMDSAQGENVDSVQERLMANARVQAALREDLERQAREQAEKAAAEPKEIRQVTPEELAAARAAKKEAKRQAKEQARREKAERARQGIRTRLAANKKLFMRIGFAVLAVVMVGSLIGVIIYEATKWPGVELDMHPEGYGDEPAASVIVMVFDDEIRNKINEADGYYLPDAERDYEHAIEDVDDVQLKTILLLRYSEFQYDVGDDFDAAVDILVDSESLFLENELYVEYYSALISLYENVDDAEMAEYYRDTMARLAPPVEIPIEEIR